MSPQLQQQKIISIQRSASTLMVAVPSLNEEPGIGPTLTEIAETLEDAKVVVIDGGSVDRTVEIAREQGAEVIVQRGRGKGAAVSQIVDHLSDGLRYVALIDADYTYPATCVPEMLTTLERDPTVGMVTARRTYRDIPDKRPLFDVYFAGNRLLTTAHRLLNGVDMRDPLTGLRVVRSDLLRGWNPQSKGFDIEVELNLHIKQSGYGIVEIPVQYRARLGEKKLKVHHGLSIMRRILVMALERVRTTYLRGHTDLPVSQVDIDNEIDYRETTGKS